MHLCARNPHSGELLTIRLESCLSQGAARGILCLFDAADDAQQTDLLDDGVEVLTTDATKYAAASLPIGGCGGKVYNLDADLVIEAVSEDLAVQRDVFAGLAQICRRDAILATNTS